MQLLLEPVAGDLAEDGGNIVVQLLHHDREPQLVVGLVQDLFEHEVLHERARHFRRGRGRAEIERMLLLPDQFVVDAVAQLMGDGEHIVHLARMVQQDIRGLDHEMVDAERAAVLALFRIGVDLAVVDEPGEDGRELGIELLHDRVDEVDGLAVGVVRRRCRRTRRSARDI